MARTTAPGLPRAVTAPRPWWITTTTAVGAASVVAALLAWASTGTVRSLALLLILLCALGLARVTASKRIAKKEEDVVGGAGYAVPRSRRVQLLHLVITVLYNAGIVITVLAGMVRFDLVTFNFRPDAVRGFPVYIGTLVLLMALAARWRIEEQGGVIRSWYTRAHGWGLLLVSLPILAAGGALAVLGEITVRDVPVLTDADLVVLVLVGVLGAATQVFLAANLPSLLDFGAVLTRLLKERDHDPDAGTPPVVYAGLIAAGGAIIVGALLTRFDLVGQLGSFRNERVALLVILIPVALAFFFLSSVLQLRREARRGLYVKKIPTRLRNNLIVYGFSSLAGLVFSVLLVMNLLGRLQDIGPIAADRDLSKDLIMLTVVASFGPIGVYWASQNKRVDNVESRLPDFLNDLAETRRAGLTLAAALRSTALSDYGALTPEIRKMADQVAWGIPFTEALRQFAERVPTNLVRRICYLIIESAKTGGSVAEILKAAAKDAYEIKALEAERRVTMMTYLIVLYVVFFVFMTVIAVLDTQFIPEVLAANEAVAQSGGEALGGAKFDAASINFVYYTAAVVQALGNGFVGGVLSEARVTAGFRHVAIMTFMAWIVFRLILAL